MGKATELVLTSRMFDATEAGEIGLVNSVVPADELERKAGKMAATIAQLPPMSVRMNKKGLRLGAEGDLASQLRYESLAIHRLRQTSDAAEARAAFEAITEGQSWHGWAQHYIGQLDAEG